MHLFLRISFSCVLSLASPLTGLMHAQFTLLRDISPGTASSVPSQNASSIISQDRMFFAADDGVSGTELWVTDGTEDGTFLLKDLQPGPGSSSPTFFHELDSCIVFLALSQNDTVMELWRTDGTSAGTQLVKEMGPVPALPIYSSENQDSYGEVLNGILYFQFEKELWRTNGTADSTLLIKPFSYSLDPYELITYKGKIFFIANSSDWMYCTDGTNPGTVKIDMPFGAQSYALSVIGDTLYFVGHFFGVLSDGYEPWITDGTRPGTKHLRNINEKVCEIDCSSMYYPNDHNFWSTHGWVVFAADDRVGNHGFKLWRTDGTEDGTTLLQKFGAVNSDEFIRSLYGFRDGVLFFAKDSVHGFELWNTKGEAWNTALLKDINEGPGDGIPFNYYFKPHTHQNKVYFQAQTATSGITLWETGGTSNSTRPVEGFELNGLTDPGNMVSLGNSLVLSAYLPGVGYEYFKFIPAELPLSVSADVKQPSCTDSANGEITVNPDGGEYPYSIAWANIQLTGFHITNLPPGTYACTITDNKGNVVIDSFMIVSPPPYDVNMKIIPAIKPFANGVIELMPVNGASPYTFTWSHDQSLQGPLASNLTPGTYSCTITDAKGCMQVSTATVIEVISFEEDGTHPVKLIPNPFTGAEVIIRGYQAFDPGTECTIYDMQGKMILKTNVSGQHNIELDVSTWLPGVYYFQIRNAGTLYFGQRVIKI